MTKNLNESAMLSELSGSTFFKPRPAGPQVVSNPPVRKSIGAGEREVLPPRAHATTPPAKDEEVIETIRKAVKQLGKEEATCRLTMPEKKTLAGLVYTYGVAGI